MLDSVLDPPPIQVLVAFESGATVSCMPGTHRTVRMMSKDVTYMPRKQRKAVSIIIPKGYVLILSQELIRAGDGYLKSRLRYHVYFDHVDAWRTENETNPLPRRF
jgi:hypothetical protein